MRGAVSAPGRSYINKQTIHLGWLLMCLITHPPILLRADPSVRYWDLLPDDVVQIILSTDDGSDFGGARATCKGIKSVVDVGVTSLTLGPCPSRGFLTTHPAVKILEKFAPQLKSLNLM